MAAQVTIPTDPAEMEAFLNDRRKLSDVMASGQFPELIRTYVDQQKKADETLSAQVKEQVQATMAQFLRDNPDAVARPPLTGGAHNFDSPELRDSSVRNSATARKQGLYSKNAVGWSVNDLFDRPADMLRAMAPQRDGFRNGKELSEKLAKVQEVQNAFGTNVPADGGFLIPEVMRSDLLMLALESALIRPRATIIPMETQRTLIPAVDATSNVSTLFGGIQVFWVDEGTAPTESSAKFSQVVLDAKKLMAYCTAPNELVADASAFNAFLSTALPKAIAFEEDYRFMQGTGVGEPLGFVSCAGAVTASAVSGQGAGTIIADNLAAMFARMLPSSLMDAIWLCDIGAFPQLALMAVQGTLGNSTPVWMNNGVIGAPPATIYGRPVYFTEKLPALGTTGDIMFVDPSFYLIGDRQTMQASASTDFLFSSDRTAYKIIERVDGRPWVQSPITPKNGGNTLSPFVQLSGTRT
jgi:HK97 family phage major capsid protein